MHNPAQAYYRAALAALSFVEARKPTKRRLGADADAVWKGFAGDLSAADRIDLLIRDADTQWPGAFGPRTVFALQGVAEDEPFGPDWQPLDAVDAEELWRTSAAASPPKDTSAALAGIAAAWSIKLSDFDVPSVGAADQLVVAGPSAISALIRAFAERQDLDWAEQVVCVATPSGHRQITAAAGALLNLPKRGVVVTAGEKAPKARAAAKALVSDDADPEDAERAKELAGG